MLLPNAQWMANNAITTAPTDRYSRVFEVEDSADPIGVSTKVATGAHRIQSLFATICPLLLMAVTPESSGTPRSFAGTMFANALQSQEVTRSESAFMAPFEYTKATHR
jgi:hypothetical protein